MSVPDQAPLDLGRALVQLTKVLVAQAEPGATAERLLHDLCEQTAAERGFVVVREGERFEQKFDRAYDRAKLAPEERRFSRTVVQHAIDERKVIATEHPATDPRFAGVESVGLMVAASVRAAPLIASGGVRPDDDSDVIGVVYLERRTPFADGVTELLDEVGALAGPVMKRAFDLEQLERRNHSLERDLFKRHEFAGIVTRDAKMLAVLKVIGQVADTEAGVMIRGETGTGKELIARAVHVNSGRRKKPFVTLHCAALPSTLLESVLFGHVRGAFTGADRDRDGRLASADGGTLFLDEVGEIPLDAQAKLLRFLQFGELQRAGSDRTDRVDVRVLSATHRDLAALVEEGRFRADLFYRLKVIDIVLPPVRERRGDIQLLAESFLAAKWRRKAEQPKLTDRARRWLVDYTYPGNVRELEHLIERVCLLATGPELDLDLWPPELVGNTPAEPRAKTYSRLDAAELDEARSAAVADVERAFVTELLARCEGNISQAARLSGINRTYLQRLVARYR